MRKINIRNESLEDVMEYQNIRMELYHVHDNVLDYFTELARKLAEILELHEHIKYIDSIIRSLERFNYVAAWRGIIALTLFPGAINMYVHLAERIEPGLKLLIEEADAYNIG